MGGVTGSLKPQVNSHFLTLWKLLPWETFLNGHTPCKAAYTVVSVEVSICVSQILTSSESNSRSPLLQSSSLRLFQMLVTGNSQPGFALHEDIPVVFKSYQAQSPSNHQQTSMALPCKYVWKPTTSHYFHWSKPSFSLTCVTACNLLNDLLALPLMSYWRSISFRLESTADSPSHRSENQSQCIGLNLQPSLLWLS